MNSFREELADNNGVEKDVKKQSLVKEREAIFTIVENSSFY